MAPIPLFAAAAAILLWAQHAVGGSASSVRTVEVEEVMSFELPQNFRQVRVWIPRLANNPFQSAELTAVKSPWPYRDTGEPEFGNRFLYLESMSSMGPAFEVRLRYLVARREQRGAKAADGDASQFRRPRGLVVVSDEIRRIAAESTRSASTTVEKARALYDYVLGRMEYDKSGIGWGRGDSVYACEIGKGNCSDFHSLFMALALAVEIPVRFQMGYPPLPPSAEGDLSTGYHCWAEFYAEERGWIPVDISEAWKNPARTDYYFGRLDPDRVLISTGRQIRLDPPQAGPPLNFLHKPYVEVDGKPFEDYEIRRYFRDTKSRKGAKT